MIGSVAQIHYSFMGATDPVQMEAHAREVAGRLKQDAAVGVSRLTALHARRERAGALS